MKLDNVADVYPLSPMQQGMLFHAISEPQSGVYVDQVAVTIDGEVSVQKLAASIQFVASRHSALRTIFVWDGVEHPLQIVREEVEFPLKEIDWQNQSDDAQRKQLLELVESNQRAGFDLAEAPLLKCALIRLAAERSVLLLTFQHMILDGWSTQLLLKEILQHYQGASLDTATFEFKQYIAHLQKQDTKAASEYWRNELQSFESVNSIGPPKSMVGADDQYPQTNLKITPEVSGAIESFARDNQVTLNTVMQAAWALTISRYSGGDRDVVFGATVAGRPHELYGIESAVGSFINTLPVRLQISPEQSVADWLKQVQQKQTEARQWEASSLVEVQKQASVPSGVNLFESILVFENYPATDRNETGLRIADVEHFERSNYPLALLVVPGDRIELIAVHELSRYSETFVNRMLENVAWLLERFTQNANSTVGALIELPPTHLALLDKSGSTEISTFKETELIRIDDVIASIGMKHPDSIAAVLDGKQLTYGQLNRLADGVAATLRSKGLKSGAFVGVCVERSFEMLIGILAALKADAAYVPLDPRYPESHLHYVIDDAHVGFVLTDCESAEVLPAGNFEKILLDEPHSPASATEGEIILRPAAKDQLAYMIYTSGSSGKPKGVMVSHANLSYSTAARTEYYGPSPETFLLLSSFAFDSSIAGIFGTLATGGKLVLPQPDQEKDVETLADLIAVNKVTRLLCLPSLYRVLLAAGAARTKLATLKVAIVAGEAIGEVATKHFELLPETQLHNEYGPTEAAVWTTAYRVHAGDQNRDIPIGAAIPGATVELMGRDGKPVAFGSVGEICVAGPGVAVGYWNLDSLTAERFCEIETSSGLRQRVYRTGDAGYFREDGQLMFCGRIDRQVKIRGHRIEPAAIENTLTQLSSVSEAFVAVPATNGPQKLVGYLIGDDQEEDNIRQSLAKSLPTFMVPDVFLFLETFPRLANGKVDASQLPQPSIGLTGNRIAEPRNETETRLVEIWQDTIGVETIGVDQDFFTIGGDSLSSIQLISKVNSEFGKRLSPVHLFEAPTVRRLADLLDDSSAVVKSKILIRFNDLSKGTPLVCVHAGNLEAFYYRFLAKHFPDRPVVALQSRGLYGEEESTGVIADIAQDYLNEIAKVQQSSFQPGGFSCDLVGYCLGAPVAFEMAKLLEDRGCPARSVTMVDAGLKWPRGMKNTIARVRADHKQISAWLPRYVWRSVAPIWDKSKELIWNWRMRNSSKPEDVECYVRSVVRKKIAEGHFDHESSEIQAPVLLVRSTETAADRIRDFHLDTERYAAGGFSIVVIDGEHESTLREPMVEHVAAAMKNHMEKVGAKEPAVI